MSRLAALLNELCPDGVEYKPLSELLSILDSQRQPVRKSDRISGPYPYYGANGIQDYVDDFLFEGSFILLGEDGSVLTEDNRPVTNWAEGKIWVNNHAHVLTQRNAFFDLRFAYYALAATDIRLFVSGGSRVKLNQSGLRAIPLPVPPLEVQQEIVRVLDAFTDLEQNLVVELELRKKQFEEYRRTLLDNPEGAECRQLGEIVQIQNGKDWKTQEPGEIPVYGSGGRMQQMVAIPSTEGPSVLLPRKGSLEVQYVEDPIWNVDTVFTTVCHAEVLNTRFFYFAMKSVDLGKVSTSATRPSLTQSALKKLTIPVPNLSMQQDIVEKLDAFDLLIQSLEQEIALRRKQYEFYRDELLTFTPKGA